MTGGRHVSVAVTITFSMANPITEGHKAVSGFVIGGVRSEGLLIPQGTPCKIDF